MTDQEAFDKEFVGMIKAGMFISRQEVWDTALAYARSRPVAPTDVTDPPKGWSWAVVDAGGKKFCSNDWTSAAVRQTTPSGERTANLAGPDPRAEAFALRKAWNDEAKSA